MSVYSSPLFQGETSGAVTTVYTVQAGTTVVIRDVEYFNVTGSSLNCYIKASVSGSSSQALCAVNTVPQGEFGQWQGRVVLEPGGYIQLDAIPAGLYLTISGYVLQ